MILIFAISISDSIIGRVYSIHANRLMYMSEYIFVPMALAFIFVQSCAIIHVMKGSEKILGNTFNNSPSVFKSIKIGLFFPIIPITFIILQIIFTHEYTLTALFVGISFSYALSLFFSGLLFYKLYYWLRSNKNYVVFFFLLSISCIIVFTIMAVLLSFIVFSNNVQDISNNNRTYPSMITGWVSVIINGTQMTLIITFISTWIATVFLLYSYIAKIGRFRFWSLVSLPILFFLSQFVGTSFDLFANVYKNNPILGITLLNTIYALSLPIGGFMFSISFLTIAKKVAPSSLEIKKYMVISAFGIALLFVSSPLGGIQTIYPPFGMITILFKGLSFVYVICRTLLLGSFCFKRYKNQIIY